jgi:hypothetical protein
MPPRSSTLVILVGLSLGCAEAHAPLQATRSMGLITLPTISALPIQVASPIRAGVPATVAVNTFGSSSCITPDGMDVAYAGETINLTPWDLVAAPNVACTDDLHAHRHAASITVARTGTVRLVAHGFVLDPSGRRVRGSVEITVPVQ